MRKVFFIIPIILILNYVFANEQVQLDIDFEYDKKSLVIKVEINNNTNSNIFMPITNTVINNTYPYHKRLDKVFSFDPYYVNNIYLYPKNYRIKKIDPFYSASRKFHKFIRINSFSKKKFKCLIPIGKHIYNFNSGEIAGQFHYFSEDIYKKLLKSYKSENRNINLNTNLIVFDTMYQQPIILNKFMIEQDEMMDYKTWELYNNINTLYFNLDMDSIRIVKF